jgi:hypothetical protein
MVNVVTEIRLTVREQDIALDVEPHLAGSIIPLVLARIAFDQESPPRCDVLNRRFAVVSQFHKQRID